MAVPKRKTIVVLILVGFFALLFGFLIWYFSGLLFGQTTVDEQGRVIRTPGLFPFGDGSVAPFVPTDTLPAPNNGNGEVVGQLNDDGVFIPRLRLISQSPTVAATTFPVTFPGRASKNYDAIRYVDKNTGHVFDARSNSLEVDRISNTTIPGIRNGFFTSSTTLVLQYDDTFDNRKTFSASLARVLGADSDNQRQLQGIFLEDNMREVTYDDRTGQLFYFREFEQDPGTTIGLVSDTNGDGKKQIFSSPLSEWKPNWEGPRGTISLDSTASYETFGPSFSLNTATAALSPFVPARLALQTLTNDAGTKSLVSLRDQGRMRLFLYDIETTEYQDLNLETTIDKCTWGAEDLFIYCGVPVDGMRGFVPDGWYQGAMRLEDEMWLIEAASGLTRPLFNPVEYYDVTIDMIDVEISPDNKYLIFKNKNDYSLWTYELLDDRENNLFLSDDLVEDDFDIDPSEPTEDTVAATSTVIDAEVNASIESTLPLEPEAAEDDF